MAAEQEPYELAKSSSGTSTIGHYCHVKERAAIDGHIRGDVRCASLILGESSEVEGNVVAEDVVIRGRVIGSIRVERGNSLHGTSHIAVFLPRGRRLGARKFGNGARRLLWKVDRVGQRTHWLKTTSDPKSSGANLKP